MSEIEPFNRRSSGSTSFRDSSSALEYIEQVLQEKGIPIKPGSRFYNYKRILDDFRLASERGNVEGLDFNLILQAKFEIYVIELAISELPRDPEVKGWLQKVKLVLSGQNFPQPAPAHTFARDHQFELLVAALSRRAGYTISLSEPDVVINHPQSAFGIAAKRLKSWKQIPRHLKKARDQIVKSGRDGIIALDITPLYNPNNYILDVTAPSQATDKVEQTAEEFINTYSQGIIAAIDDERVFGIMVFMSGLMYVRSIPRLGLSTRWSVRVLCRQEDPRDRVLHEFTRRFDSAVHRGNTIV